MTELAAIQLLSDTAVSGTGRAARLFVFIHGYTGSGDRFGDLLDAVREEWGDAVDILAPRYPAGPTSNADPFQLAREISILIAHIAAEREAMGDGGYETITLCGFSAGGMLIRKAVVYGLGALEDHPFPEEGRRTARRWEEAVVPKLDRLVLLAAVNRGWSYRRKPRHMPWPRYVLVRVGVLLGRLRLAGRFLMALERGRPLVANLRVQWLRLHHAGSPLPPTIQFLGDRDDVVEREDNKDLMASPDFIFIPVAATGHATILRFDDTPAGRNRRELVVAAVSAPLDELAAEHAAATGDLRSEELASPSDEPVNLVFLMHGIRANSDWPNRLAAKIRERDPGAVCIVSSYGYFPMLRFLLFGSRRRNVRWFMDEYTEGLSRASGRAVVHFVGHSNGTHLLAEALHRYAAVRVDRVALMGSVVPKHFRWDDYADTERVRQVRNDRASNDFIVGVFPGFLQRLGSVTKVPWFRDVGDGGFRGFDNPAPQHQENFYFEGGHSAAYEDEHNLDSLAAFIVDGDTSRPRGLVDSPSKLADYASRLNWAVWALLGALLTVGALLVAGTWGGLALAGYLAVLALLLLTV